MKPARSVRCKGCKSVVGYSLVQAGKDARCPSCDMLIHFPDVRRILFYCDQCGSKLQAPEDRIGDMLACPKCQQKVRVPSESMEPPASPDENEGKEGALSLQDDVPEQEDGRLTRENRKAYSAWTEFEESRRDSYGMALLRTPLYPIQVAGGIVLFVLGVPFLITVARLLSEVILYEAALPTRNEQAVMLAATGMAAFVLAMVLVVMAMSASFLFSLMRNTATRSECVPIIQGMPHKINLTTFVGWAVVWFGLPVLLGFVGAGGGWRAHAGVIVTALLVSPFAMASFVGVSMEGAKALFSFDRIGTMLGKSGGAFMGAFAIGILSALILAGVGMLLEHVALGYAGDAPSERVISFVLHFLAVCFYLFPAVGFIRALGVFAQYHYDDLPWTVSKTEQASTSWLLRGLLVLGCALCFFPIRQQAYVTIESNRSMAQVQLALEKIEQFSFKNQYHSLPYSEEELLTRFPDQAMCPFVPEERVGYVVADIPHRADLDCLMAIYPKKPSPQNGRWAVLFQGRKVRVNLTDATFQKLLELQKKLLASPDDTRIAAEMRQLMLVGM